MKTLISLFGNLSLLLAIAANCPSDLQALIMSVLPKQAAPYAAIIFGVAGIGAKILAARQVKKDIETAATTTEGLTKPPTGLGPLHH